MDLASRLRFHYNDGFAVRMLAVRFRRQLKFFTAADTGGAH
jgi:hypothetical protein